MLARLFFLLLVCFAVSGMGYFLWTKLIHPMLFKEDMSHKLEDAGEDFVESQVDKKANKLRKKGEI